MHVVPGLQGVFCVCSSVVVNWPMNESRAVTLGAASREGQLYVLSIQSITQATRVAQLGVHKRDYWPKELRAVVTAQREDSSISGS